MAVGSVASDKGQTIQCISFYWSLAIYNSLTTPFYCFNKLVKYIIFLTWHLYGFIIKPRQILVRADNSFIGNNVMKNIVDCFTKIWLVYYEYLINKLFLCKRVILHSCSTGKIWNGVFEISYPSWGVGCVLLNLWNWIFKNYDEDPSILNISGRIIFYR